jgi:branched-chain amino acid transport system ATP-binding protein
MLDVRNLTVRFGGLIAVDDLSFTVERGSVFTLIGPNGAGKTTAFNAIGGFAPVASGAVRFEGHDLVGMKPEEIAALGVRRTFQNNGILPEMTALENVLTGLELGIASSFFGTIVASSRSRRAEAEAVRRARAMLVAMEIGDLETRVAADLSFGQQRLVEIARALVAGASFIMLDEPAVGLSPSERGRLGAVLRGLAQNGVTILLVEHVQDLVAAVSDQVLVLNNGRKIVQCPPGEVRDNKEAIEAYLGQ